MKKVFQASLIFMIFFILSVVAQASFSDINGQAYSESVERVCSLGFMSGGLNNTFAPSKKLTREQMAKIITLSCGYENEAKIAKGKKTFKDLSKSRWSNGYISVAINKKLMEVDSRGLFKPEKELRYAELCTIVVRALGYKNQKGKWPANYIEKASQIGLTDGIDLNWNELVPRWAVAMVIDRFWIEQLKGGKLKNIEEKVKLKPNISKEIIMLSDMKLSPSLLENEILTDAGVFVNEDKSFKYEYGKKYRIIKSDNKIVKAFKTNNKVTKISVDMIEFDKIYYSNKSKLTQLNLHDDLVTYYNGKKSTFGEVKSNIRSGSSIIMVENSYKKNNYIVLYDLIFNNPTIVKDYKQTDKMIGSISLDKGITLLKNGVIAQSDDIMNDDLIYEASDIWGNRKHISIVDSKVDGKLLGLLPNAISVKQIKIGEKIYDFSQYSLVKQENLAQLKLNDNILAYLAEDGKIVEVMKLDGPYGIKTELIITGNNKIYNNLPENQIYTDKGLYLYEKSSELELGARYLVRVNGTKILSMLKKINKTRTICAQRMINHDIEYKFEGASRLQRLSSEISYFYKGAKTSYEQLEGTISVFSLIVFGEYDDRNGDEYAVIVDPIVSKPSIYMCEANNNSDLIKEGSIIIKNGIYAGINQLAEGDVLYKISDYNGAYSYVFVTDKKVKGKIESIVPNILSPKSIIVNSINYELSEYFELNKLLEYSIGDKVEINFTIDNKVINIKKGASDINQLTDNV